MTEYAPFLLSALVKRPQTTLHTASEIEISFGVKLSTAAGAVIASASAEANFDVTVRWTGTHKETTP